MRVNGYRCDTCGKEKLTPSPLVRSLMNVQYYEPIVPSGWFCVDVDGKEPSGTWTFCSPECLRGYNFSGSAEQEGLIQVVNSGNRAMPLATLDEE